VTGIAGCNSDSGKLERTLTRRDLTRLLVGVFGLLILASAVVGLPLNIYSFTYNMIALNGPRSVHSWQEVALIGVSHFGPFLAYTVLGLCLLWWSGRIVDRVSPAPEPAESEAMLESSDLRNIEIGLIAVVGLYFVADGFADLCSASFGLGRRYMTDGTVALFWQLDSPFFAGALLKLIIGISLILGRGRTAAVLRGARIWVRKMRTWPD
jgi:hypothetical protein